MSQPIVALEREVGQPLVERGTVPVELTEAGRALTRHATGIFARLDGAEQELAEIAGRRHARLRFGTFPTALATIVPPAFERFGRADPEVTLTVVDDHLRRPGEFDLALLYDHEALPEIGARDLVRTLAAGAPVRRISAARQRDGYHGSPVTAKLDSLRAAAAQVGVPPRSA